MFCYITEWMNWRFAVLMIIFVPRISFLFYRIWCSWSRWVAISRSWRSGTRWGWWWVIGIIFLIMVMIIMMIIIMIMMKFLIIFVVYYIWYIELIISFTFIEIFNAIEYNTIGSNTFPILVEGSLSIVIWLPSYHVCGVDNSLKFFKIFHFIYQLLC